MFFILSKILHFAIKPLIWIFLATLFGLWKKRGKNRYWLLLFLSAYLLSNQFIVDRIFYAWEHDAIHYNEIPAVKGIIVLGGYSSYYKPADRPLFRSASDRMMQALYLSRAKGIAPIIFTGGSGSLYRPEEKEGIFISKFLQEMELDTGQCYFETEARNTYQNAVNTLQLIEQKKLPEGPYLLVTSAFHMPRSLACFEKIGLDVMPFAVDHKVGELEFNLEYLLMPSVDALHKWEILLHEFLGYLSYKMAGKA